MFSKIIKIHWSYFSRLSNYSLYRFRYLVEDNLDRYYIRYCCGCFNTVYIWQANFGNFHNIFYQICADWLPNIKENIILYFPAIYSTFMEVIMGWKMKNILLLSKEVSYSLLYTIYRSLLKRKRGYCSWEPWEDILLYCELERIYLCICESWNTGVWIVRRGDLAYKSDCTRSTFY